MILKPEDVEVFVIFIPVATNSRKTTQAVLNSFTLNRDSGLRGFADFFSDVGIGECFGHGVFLFVVQIREFFS